MIGTLNKDVVCHPDCGKPITYKKGTSGEARVLPSGLVEITLPSRKGDLFGRAAYFERKDVNLED